MLGQATAAADTTGQKSSLFWRDMRANAVDPDKDKHEHDDGILPLLLLLLVLSVQTRLRPFMHAAALVPKLIAGLTTGDHSHRSSKNTWNSKSPLRSMPHCGSPWTFPGQRSDALFRRGLFRPVAYHQERSCELELFVLVVTLGPGSSCEHFIFLPVRIPACINPGLLSANSKRSG